MHATFNSDKVFTSCNGIRRKILVYQYFRSTFDSAVLVTPNGAEVIEAKIMGSTQSRRKPDEEVKRTFLVPAFHKMSMFYDFSGGRRFE